MALTKFTNLDFDQIKTEIKDYVRSNSNFTDFDFEGSNMSMLLDILAYNSYITSYNSNMVANEVFLDSATLRENVIGLARNIGYVPRSHRSGSTTVNFTVDLTSVSSVPRTLTLKKGLFATSESFNNVNFAFSTIEDYTVSVIDKIATFENVTIYEGNLLTKNFTVYGSEKTQRFILENPYIDTRSISVTVKPYSESQAGDAYEKVETLLSLDATRKIYMVNEIEDERYELVFGDGIFGRKVVEGEQIVVNYLAASGDDSTNISNFTFSGRVINPDTSGPTNGTISGISVNDTVSGHQAIESVSSVRKYAPKVFSTQYRAVTASDFESLIPTVYPNAESVSAFGGEDLTPPQYGRVYISVKPENGRFLSRAIKNDIIEKLKKYSVAGIVTELIDLKYLYIELNTSAYFNANKTNASTNLNTSIVSALTNYANSNEMNKFGSRFKYSKVLSIIDGVDRSITSNITTVTMRRDLRCTINAFADYEICYGNQIHVDKDQMNIKSSGFTISGYPGTVYLGDEPNADMKTGTVFLFKKLSETEKKIIRSSVGTIDYVKGEILLKPINISNTAITKSDSPIIEIQVVPESFDVIGKQDLYLQLDISNSSVSMVSDLISSGSDISGTRYTTTSSFSNGKLTR